MKHLKLLLATALFASCNLSMNDDGTARETAMAWADAYFNCDFHEAEEYSTKESGKWLRFAASNVTEQDLQLLRERNAVAEADEYFPVANDTLRVVRLTVRNYLAPKALGEPSQLAEEGHFNITVVKHDNNWKVKMEGMPRSEKD